jgi:DNA-binding MarR family transcriptional regulator
MSAARIASRWMATYDENLVQSGDRTQALLDEIAELWAVVLRISRGLDDNQPLTSTQRLALLELSIVGPMRLNDLAARMDTTAATASRTVDVLEKLAFVERGKDSEDGRAIAITATAKGQRWAARRRAKLCKVLEQVDDAIVTQDLLDHLSRLSAGLRDASGHDEVSRGALLSR